MKKDITEIEKSTPPQRALIKNYCIRNAKFLIKQARFQFKSGNYNLATFLAITAYEESLKFALFNSYEGQLVEASKFNKIWRSHKLKMLSKYATIRISFDENKVAQIFYIPEDVDSFNEELNEIIKKRENALYVDFYNKKINIPEKANPADAIIEINRAERSINDVLEFDKLIKGLERAFKFNK